VDWPADLTTARYWLVLAPILAAVVGVSIELLMFLRRQVRDMSHAHVYSRTYNSNTLVFEYAQMLAAWKTAPQMADDQFIAILFTKSQASTHDSKKVP
jgi:hypothetical protein